MKKCNKCGIEKPATTEHFGPQKDCADGLRPVCRQCRRDAELERWRAKADAQNAAKRESYAKKRKGKVRTWVRRNPSNLPRRRCKECQLIKTLESKNWQRETRKKSGWRQPCIACLKKRREAKKIA